MKRGIWGLKLKHRGYVTALLAVGVSLHLFGCSDSQPGSGHVASAQSKIEKGDLAGATFELRAALQETPNSPESRRLLGQILMQQGAAELAAVEYVKLRELAPSDATIPPLLAKAWIGAGQFKKVIDEFSRVKPSDPAAVDLAVNVAVARAMLGEAAVAEEMLTESLRAVPNHTPAMLELARLYASKNQQDKATALVDDAIKKSPNSADAWQLKGDLLLYGDRNFDAAVTAYKQSLSIDPTSLRRHVSAVSALLLARKPAEAEKQFLVMKSVFPGHIQTAFLEAQFTELRGERKVAAEMYEKLLGVAPDNVRLLLLAGANAVELGHWSRAEALLGKAVQLAPKQTEGARLLARTYMGMGSVRKASQILKPLVQRPDATSEDFYLAGTVELQSGKPGEAEALFKKAAVLAPNDAQVRIALALRQMARGEVDSAMATLSAVAAADKGVGADLALIGASLRRGDLDAASKAIDALERKLPGQPLPFDLRARVFLAKRDLVGERVNLEKAVSLAPTYFPAVARLAEIELIEGQVDKARQRFEAVVKVDPKNVQARTAIADLRARQGGSVDEVVELFKQAQAANPGDKLPRLRLVEYLLAKRSSAKALAVAQDAVNAIGGDADLLEALGRCQLAVGDTLQAISSFNKVVGMRPDHVQPLLQLSRLYEIRGDMAQATQQLRRALEIAPNDLAAQRALIQLFLRAGKTDDAIAVTRSMQKQRPGSAFGYALEGDIHHQRKNWSAMRAALNLGLTRAEDKGYLATKLHGGLLAEGRADEASRFAEDWLRSNPNDAVLKFHLGMVALKQKDYPKAQQWFRAVVDKQANHAIALNNLAWVTAELKQPGAAALVGKALNLMPGNPEFLDTQAFVLAQDGDLRGAITAQRLAAQVTPDRFDYRLKLGRLYVRAGDKAAARSTLEALTASGADASSKAAAQQLLSEL